MDWFLHSGTAAARLARTLVEVLLSWLIANLGDIFGLFVIDPTVKALVISALTMLFTAVLGFINDNRTKEEHDENDN
jgi:VIT1/CCC1 family predicted Fe2+/Mn2+ transporter